MRNKKRAATFGLALVLFIFGVIVCRLEYFTDALGIQEPRVKDTLEYLSEKYDGQEFIYQSHEYVYGKILVYCYPEWGTYETERVRVRRKVVDGEVQYMDTYFNILMREDGEAEVLAVCADLGLKAKVFMDTDDFFVNNQFDSSKTYEDFVKWDSEDGQLSLRSYAIFLETDDFTKCELVADQINEAMEAKKYNCHNGIIFCNQEKFEYYNRANSGEIREDDSVVWLTRSTKLKEVID